MTTETKYKGHEIVKTWSGYETKIGGMVHARTTLDALTKHLDRIAESAAHFDPVRIPLIGRPVPESAHFFAADILSEVKQMTKGDIGPQRDIMLAVDINEKGVCSVTGIIVT